MLDYVTSGYCLMELPNSSWALKSNGKIYFIGTFVQVVYVMVNKLGFNVEEVEFAAETMDKNKHNAAHFGMYKGFIYSFDANSKERKGV